MGGTRARSIGGTTLRSKGGTTPRSMGGPPARSIGGKRDEGPCGEPDIPLGLAMGGRMSTSRGHAEPGREASDGTFDEEGTAKGIAIGGRSLSMDGLSLSMGARSLSIGARSLSIGTRSLSIGTRSLSIGTRSRSIGARSLSSGGLPCGSGGRPLGPGFDSDADRLCPSNALGGELLCICPEAMLITSPCRSYSLGGRGLG
ncbi:hypothetical protein EV121DRAFT_276360 [Schizophyllum commune]